MALIKCPERWKDVSNKFNEDEQINKKIGKIIIEDGIEKIGEKCFADLRYQKMDVSLPDSLTEIGKMAFYHSWVSDIQFPKNLKKIGDYAFEDNYLECVFLPDSLEELGIYAFAGGKYIKEIRFPSHMTTIPAVSFAECLKLETIEWPKKLRKIDARAFETCSFEKFKIPDTVQSVGDEVFYNCSRLKTITVGKSVRKISKNFASSCFSLKKIVNLSKTTIPLDTLMGKRNWYVGKKKVTKLKPGKTAKSVYRKYKIKYILDGGRCKGKHQKHTGIAKKQSYRQKQRKKGIPFWDGIYLQRMTGNVFLNIYQKNYMVRLGQKLYSKSIR